MLTVEFLGLPGAGKSTLAAQLTRTLGARTLETAVRKSIVHTGHDPFARLIARTGGSLWRAVYARSPDRFEALARFVAVHPELVEIVCALQAGKLGRDHRRRSSLPYFLNFIARYQLASEGPADAVTVIDEGFAQKSIMLFAHEFDGREDESLLRRYLSLAPRPTVLITVLADNDTCLHRITTREWTDGVLGGETESSMQFLQGARQVQDRVVDGRFYEAAEFSVSGEKDPRLVSDELADALASVLGDFGR